MQLEASFYLPILFYTCDDGFAAIILGTCLICVRAREFFSDEDYGQGLWEWKVEKVGNGLAGMKR